MRLTQQQRGSLKLEAYTRLLQELLLIQLQQATAMHSAPAWTLLSQVSHHWASTLIANRSQRYRPYASCSKTALASIVPQHQAVALEQTNLCLGDTMHASCLPDAMNVSHAL